MPVHILFQNDFILIGGICLEPEFSYSMTDIAQLAQSPAGRQLIALLQQQSIADLHKAMQSAAAGDYLAARNSLGSLLDSPEIQKLLKQLGG